METNSVHATPITDISAGNAPLTLPENPDPLTLANAIVSVLDEKKAYDIKVLKVADQTIVADYFVLCTGTSNTQVRGLSGELEFKLGQAGVTATRTEGYEDGNWIVMDYSSVLVHIFRKEARDFYNLERLWADAEDVDISALLKD